MTAAAMPVPIVTIAAFSGIPSVSANSARPAERTSWETATGTPRRSVRT